MLVRWLDKKHKTIPQAQNGGFFMAIYIHGIESVNKIPTKQRTKWRLPYHHGHLFSTLPVQKQTNKTPPLIPSPNTHGWKLLHNSNTSAMAAVAVVFEWSFRWWTFSRRNRLIFSNRNMGQIYANHLTRNKRKLQFIVYTQSDCYPRIFVLIPLQTLSAICARIGYSQRASAKWNWAQHPINLWLFQVGIYASFRLSLQFSQAENLEIKCFCCMNLFDLFLEYTIKKYMAHPMPQQSFCCKMV